MTFLLALYSSYIRVLTEVNRSHARLEGLRNARSAILTLTDELKSITRNGTQFLLVGINDTAPFGNGIDDDRDRRIDEEVLNGLDDDGDWNPATDDLHALIDPADPIFDRYTYTVQGNFGSLFGSQAQDLGDLRVDEDNRFGLDRLVIRVFPNTAVPNLTQRTITYFIGSLDGRSYVLIREARTEFTDQPPVVSSAPLAFGVMGFDVLYWDPNGDPRPGQPRSGRPYWREEWDSGAVATFDAPRLPLPASIFVRVSVYADPKPIETYTGGDAIETIYMQTVINIEDTIGDALYPRPTI